MRKRPRSPLPRRIHPLHTASVFSVKTSLFYPLSSQHVGKSPIPEKAHRGTPLTGDLHNAYTLSICSAPACLRSPIRQASLPRHLRGCKPVPGRRGRGRLQRATRRGGHGASPAGRYAHRGARLGPGSSSSASETLVGRRRRLPTGRYAGTPAMDSVGSSG